MRPVIALISDFGLEDPYVGQMKAAALCVSPDAAIVDISHGVKPFDIAQAALYLESSRKHFPRGTVFTVVVDPGVGTERRVVVLEKEGRFIIAPDNGVLSAAIADDKPSVAYDLTEHVSSGDVCATFHGRDVFAPLAARIAAGTKPSELGEPLDVDSLEFSPWAQVDYDRSSRTLHGAVLHVDRFGNCIMNFVDETWLPVIAGWEGITLVVGGKAREVHLTYTYAQLPQSRVGILAGSQGFIELCVNQASAADELGLEPGASVTLVPGVPA